MNNNLKEITIVLIAYKSAIKIKRFVKNIPSSVKILIIDNSKDHNLKKMLNEKDGHLLDDSASLSVYKHSLNNTDIIKKKIKNITKIIKELKKI